MDHAHMDHSQMDHSGMDHGGMDHGGHGGGATEMCSMNVSMPTFSYQTASARVSLGALKD